MYVLEYHIKLCDQTDMIEVNSLHSAFLRKPCIAKLEFPFFHVEKVRFLFKQRL